MEINFENFIKFNIQVGTIVDVKENKKARKPAYVIDIAVSYTHLTLPTIAGV